MYFFLYLFSFLIYARILRLRRIGSTKEDSNSQFTVPQFYLSFHSCFKYSQSDSIFFIGRSSENSS